MKEIFFNEFLEISNFWPKFSDFLKFDIKKIPSGLKLYRSVGTTFVLELFSKKICSRYREPQSGPYLYETKFVNALILNQEASMGKR